MSTLSVPRAKRQPTIRVTDVKVDEFAFNRIFRDQLDEWQRCLIMSCSFAGTVRVDYLSDGIQMYLEAPSREGYEELLIELVPIFVEFSKTMPLRHLKLHCKEFSPGRVGKYKVVHDALEDKATDLKMLLTRFEGYPWFAQVSRIDDEQLKH